METGEVYVCGGGAYNSYLLEQLRWRLRKHIGLFNLRCVRTFPYLGRGYSICMVSNALCRWFKWKFASSHRRFGFQNPRHDHGGIKLFVD